MICRSTGIRRHGEDFIIDGELTIRGVTRPVSLKFAKSPAARETSRQETVPDTRRS